MKISVEDVIKVFESIKHLQARIAELEAILKERLLASNKEFMRLETTRRTQVKTIAELEGELELMAKLASDKPEFNNPLVAMQAKTLRDKILKQALPCKICNDTGFYQEQQDGGASTLFCDCPIGKKKQTEFEDENPDCKALPETKAEEGKS